MLELSQEYKTALSQHIIDDVLYNMEIEFGLIDNNAMQNAVIENNGAEYETVYGAKNCPLTMNDAPVEKQYASLEDKFFRLDDENICLAPPDEEGKYYQGYVSNATADETGKFKAAELPFLRVKMPSDSTMNIRGITLWFDTLHGDYTTEADLKVSCNNNSTKTVTLKDINAPVYEYIPDDSGLFENAAAITLTFKKMNRGNIRVRVTKLVLGVMQKYSDEDLSGDFTCEYDLDASGSRLPQQKASFTVNMGSDNPYSPDNPNGYYPFIEDNQPICARLLVRNRKKELLDTINICDMALSGDIVSDGGNVTFNAVSYLQNANNKYTPPNNNLNTLGGYLEDVLKQMNLPLTRNGRERWVFDDNLNSKTTNVILPADGLSLKECIQLIAQAGCCAVYEDANGIIHIQPPKAFDGQKDIAAVDYDKMFGKPKLNRYPPLKEVRAYYYNNGVKDEFENHISDKKHGENEVIENIFITSDEYAKQTADFVGKELERQNLYTAEIIGGAELEPFDWLKVQTEYIKECPAILVRKTFKYNGAVNCTVQYFTDEKLIE